MPPQSNRNVPAFVLRVGLSLVILWFGANQLLEPDMWTSWVPAWTSMLGLTAERVVFLNGIFEVLTVALLLVGILPRLVAGILFLHMVVLVIEIGLSSIGVRDFGLAAGFLALFLEKNHSWCLYTRNTPPALVG